MAATQKRLQEEQHLIEAHHHLAVADRCVVRQLSAISKLEQTAQHSIAVRLFNTMMNTYDLMLRHTAQIEQELGQQGDRHQK
jgi:hypothetical protein